jgi:hypothetical protein
MLRLLVLALIFANGAYFAWSGGLLLNYGMGPAQQREPQRVGQQIKPETVKILSAAEFKRVEALVQADAAPKECLRAGPLDEAQAVLLRRALESSLGSTGWQLDEVMVPARWIVYFGKFANADGQAKKRAELVAMNLSPQVVTNPTLEIGLSLGGFETQAAATAELNKLNLRGIRTARVVQERAESRATHLKLPAITEAQKARLSEVRAALAGKPLTNCN